MKKTLDNVIEITTKEVTEMSTEGTKATKKELSRAEKKALRREAIYTFGRLHLDDKYKEEGYRYRPVNVIPGNVETYKSMGYEVVTHDIKSGSGKLETPEVNGAPTEFDVGGSAGGSMKAIWMRISEDDAQILDEIRDDKAREQLETIKKVPGIPDSHLVGKVTKENLK